MLVPGKSRGRGKWVLRYISPTTRKRRDMGLGTYPEVSIAEARAAASKARSDIADKLDPIDQRAAETALVREADVTFEEAALSLHRDLSKGFRNAKHSAQWLTTLKTYIFPFLATRSISSLRAADFADALKPIWLAKPETASRVRQRCDAVMKWGVARGHTDSSPLSAVDHLLPRQPTKRTRVVNQPAVPWQQVPDVVSNVLDAGRPTVGKLALKFLILTAARSGEVRGMRWSEIDLDQAIWTIPASRMKAGLQHRVPLSSVSLALLQQLELLQNESDIVFVSRNSTPISDMTLTKVLRDAEIASDVPGRYATAHGFRSSFRDWASEEGYSRDLAERALAHTIRSSTEAAYSRSDRVEQRRPILKTSEANLSPIWDDGTGCGSGTRKLRN